MSSKIYTLYKEDSIYNYIINYYMNYTKNNMKRVQNTPLKLNNSKAIVISNPVNKSQSFINKEVNTNFGNSDIPNVINNKPVIEEEDDNVSTDSNDILDLQITTATPFNKVVKKQVKLGNLIKKLEEDKKSYTDSKKPCEEYLLKYMKSKEENSIEITDGRLVINKSETKKTLTQDTMKNTIESLINNLFDVLTKSGDLKENVKNKFNIPNLVKQTMEKMDNDRGKQSREYLKRVNKRIPKKKEKKEKKQNKQNKQDLKKDQKST